MLVLLLFLISLPYILLQWGITLLILILPLIFGALIAAPIGSLFKKWPRWLWIFGNDDQPCYGTWFQKVKWYGYRNPIANMRHLFREPRWVRTYGATDSMDEVRGFQVRWRHSVFADSLRISWGKPDPSTGKKEMYFGWKIRSITPGVGFAFSVRMTWEWLVVLIGLHQFIF